ncbi:MAG: SDR family oxidoreductase [Bacteroidaceae bacterium]|nr:SDR family oxidoreductase [Bacteroidaceae bacterium]
MNIFKKIYNGAVNAAKSALFQKLIRREPVVIRDVTTNLLSGKSAIVTGGNSGIGYAIAKKFIEAGAEQVTIIGRNADKTKSVAEELGCSYLVLDVTDIDAMVNIVSAYIANRKVDILVNSAGVLDKEPWLEKTSKGFDVVMNTNLKAAYFMSQTIAKHMVSKGIHGHILNISSSSSKRPGWGPYQLSKHALNAMTEGFAHNLACHGITVNGIAPGITATPMQDGNLEEGSLTYNNPMRRAQSPEEIANLAVFMVSDLGNSIIGDTVMMTGGSGNLSIHG